MQPNYIALEELSKSDFEIVAEEPNIIGWKVRNEGDTFVGEVKELLFDPKTLSVRYLIIDLTDNGMNLDGKQVMIPIGLAHLKAGNHEVVLPNIHIDQFIALPSYTKDEIGPQTEMNIRAIIGSPAALRIEETITIFDQHEFYSHHHFDLDKFYQRSRSDVNTKLTNEPFPSSEPQQTENPATRGI
jgi:hypothetical protein